MTQRKTIGTGWKTLSSIQDGDSTAILELTNDSHVIPYDENGENGNYSTCETVVEFYVGNKKQTGVRDIKIKTGKGISSSDYTFDYDTSLDGMKFKLNNLTEKESYVEFTKTYNQTNYTTRFSVSKVRNGNSNFLIDLTNDNHTFVADEKGKISSGVNTNIETKVMVYKGTTLQNIVKPITFEPARIEGLNYSVRPGTNIIDISAQEGTALPNSGGIDIIVKIDNTIEGVTKEIELRKTFSFSKIRNGLATAILELSNDSHVIPCDNEGNENYTTCETEVVFYVGNKKNDVAITANPSTGITGRFSRGNRGAYSVSNMTTDEGYVDFSVVYDSITYKTKFTISKIRNGNDTIYMDLTNDNHSFAADASGHIPEEVPVTTKVLAYKGAKELGGVKITRIQATSGFKTSGVGTNTATLTAEVGSSMKTSGTIDISAEITYRENAQNKTVTLTKSFSYTKLKEGKGISEVVEYYARSEFPQGVISPTPSQNPETGNTNNIQGSWSTRVPQLNNKYRFLWNYERIVYNNLNTIVHTPAAMIGTYSENGEGIDKVENFYIATQYGTVEEIEEHYPFSIDNAGQWTTQVPMISETLKYLWNIEKITYTKKDPSNIHSPIRREATEPTLIGTYGEKGKDGKKILIADTYEREQTKEEWENMSGRGFVMTWESIRNAADFRIGDIMVIKGVATDKGNLQVQLYTIVEDVREWEDTIIAESYTVIMSGEEGKPGKPGNPGPPGPLLDWLDDWNGRDVIFDNEGKRVITPRLFAGSKDGQGRPTGVAMGKNMFGSGSVDAGIAGYQQGKKTFHIDTQGNVMIGDPVFGSGISFNGSMLNVKADSMIFRSTGQTVESTITNKVNAGVSDAKGHADAGDRDVKSYTDGQISNVNGRISINSKSIDSLNKKMSEAQLAIKPDSIVGTVTQHMTNGEKTFMTRSEVKQEVDKVTFSFDGDLNRNLFYNSRFERGVEQWFALRWDPAAGGRNTFGVTKATTEEKWTISDRNTIYGQVSGLNSQAYGKSLRSGFDSHWIDSRPKQEYTFKALFAAHRTTDMTIEMIECDSSKGRLRITAWKIGPGQKYPMKQGGKDRKNWVEVAETFKTGERTRYIHLRVFMGDWTRESDNAICWMAEPLLIEGKDLKAVWTCRADESYNGVTTIDGTGVRVDHSDGSYSHMTSKGFMWYDKEQDRKYHNMIASGTFDAVPSDTVVSGTLPKCFRGKDYVLHWWAGNWFPPGNDDATYACNVEKVSHDKSTGKFELRAALTLTKNPDVAGGGASRRGKMNILWMAIC